MKKTHSINIQKLGITGSIYAQNRLTRHPHMGFGDNIMSQNLMPSMISIDPHINRIILEAIADDDTRNIINTTLTEPKIIFDILKSCNIPQTSGYRKINNLIKNRLLMITGYERTDDGRIISKYQSVFENIRVHIEKNKVTVHVSPTKKALDRGVICPVIQGNEILLSWNQE